MKDIITIAVVDFSPEWGNKQRNANRIAGYVEAAGKQGADLIVLPEIGLIGGVDDLNEPDIEKKAHRRGAETIPGLVSEMIAEITKKYDMYAVFGMPERSSGDPSKVYNSAAVCGPDGVIGAYRKWHLPCDDANWGIKFDGNIKDNLMLFDSPWGPIGLTICYDAYEFPEFSRYYRAKGARLMLNPTAVTTAVGAEKCNLALCYQSGTSAIYIASSNIFGMQPGLNYEFMGGSSIIGPSAVGADVEYYAGNPFGAPGAVRGKMYMATVDLSYVDRSHIATIWGYNTRIFQPDWRPDVYKDMLQDVIDDPSWQSKFKGK